MSYKNGADFPIKNLIGPGIPLISPSVRSGVEPRWKEKTNSSCDMTRLRQQQQQQTLKDGDVPSGLARHEDAQTIFERMEQFVTVRGKAVA